MRIVFVLIVQILIIYFVNCKKETPDLTNTTNSTNTCYERLIDQGNALSQFEYDQLCDSLNRYPLFLMRIRRDIEYAIQSAVFFEASSFKFFDEKCKSYINMCQFGFLIDIYVDDKIIIIQPGSKSKSLVNDVYRKRTVASVRPELLKGKWSKALFKILTMIIYKESGGTTMFFKSTNDDPENFFYFALVPCLTVGFFAMTGVLYQMSKGFFNKDCFDYMDHIRILWKDISNTADKKIILDPYICIFCWKKTSNIKEVFMYCCHSYHEKCLRKWRLYQYRCCPCSYEAIQEVEEKNKNIEKIVYLNLEDLKILLGLSRDAFRKENLYDYFVERENEIDQFNKDYGVSLEELCWIYQNKVTNYKSYRIFYKMYKVIKMAVFILAFYPKFLKTKKGKLITKLLNVKQRGATVQKLN